MKTLLRMALRNIRRNKRRSLLAVLSVTLSIAAILFAQGFIGGMQKSIIKNSTKNDCGHIRIVTSGFNEKLKFYPVTENIPAPGALVDYITGDPKIAQEIELTAERFFFGVLLEHGGRNKAALAFCGDSSKEKQLFMLDRSITEGQYLADSAPAADSSTAGKGKKSHPIIIGQKMAETLKLRPGDTMKVLIQGSDYGLHVPELTVSGIFSTGLNDVDDNLFQLGLDDAKAVLHAGAGAQQLIIMLKDYERAEPVAALIKNRLARKPEYAGLVVTPWTRAGGYAQTLLVSYKFVGLIYLVIAFLGAFIITNIMTMVVLERRKEIGIIKSMGFSRSDVLVLFLLEGISLGAGGSIAGLITGGLASLYFIFAGANFYSSVGQLNFPIDSVIKFTFSPGGVIAIMFMGIIVASIVSLIPARQAAKMNAVDAIKSV